MSSSPLDSPPAPRPSRPPRIARIALSTPGAGPARLPRCAILAGVALALLVPLVIALMWFALSYTGYVMAHPIVWQTPVDAAAGTGRTLAMAFLAALIVTACDLGVDPNMVHKPGAWIMDKKDGWWFGETLQGFAGWMLVAFAIVCAFRLSSTRSLRAAAAANAARPALRHVALPLLLYGGLMVYEVTQGVPVETRTIALFVMGIPLFCAGCGLARWHGERAAAPRGEPA